MSEERSMAIRGSDDLAHLTDGFRRQRPLDMRPQLPFEYLGVVDPQGEHHAGAQGRIHTAVIGQTLFALMVQGRAGARP